MLSLQGFYNRPYPSSMLCYISMISLHRTGPRPTFPLGFVAVSFFSFSAGISPFARGFFWGRGIVSLCFLHQKILRSNTNANEFIFIWTSSGFQVSLSARRWWSFAWRRDGRALDLPLKARNSWLRQISGMIFRSWLVIGIEEASRKCPRISSMPMTNYWKFRNFERSSESKMPGLVIGLSGYPVSHEIFAMISFRVPGWWWRFATKGADSSRCIFFLNKSWNILKDTEVSWSWHRMTLSCLVDMCKFNGKSQLFLLSGIGPGAQACRGNIHVIFIDLSSHIGP